MKPYDPTQMPPERFPRMAPEQYTDAQKEVAAAIAAGPRGEVRGPFLALLRSPGLANVVQQVGEYLRYKCPVERRLAEMVTLIAARHWSQNYEFNSHYEHAMKAGLKPALADAIAEGRRPTSMAEDEEIAYELITEGLQNKCVCDATYERAKAKFGEQVVIDMLAIAGYYAMVALILNVARTRLPAGKPLPLTPYPY
jgi:4-carboxymuconolactone decarboxylase